MDRTQPQRVIKALKYSSELASISQIDALKYLEGWSKKTNLPSLLVHGSTGVITCFYVYGRCIDSERNLKQIAFDNCVEKLRETFETAQVQATFRVPSLSIEPLGVDLLVEPKLIDEQRWLLCKVTCISSLMEQFIPLAENHSSQASYRYL